MKSLRIALFAALAALLVSCGGGTGGTGVTNNTPSNAVSIGVMTKGSVIVNGVHFDDNGAMIKIDDTPKTPNDLQSGMVVRLRGQINSNAATGTAQVVNVSTEVRGTVQTPDGTTVPPTFTVVSQTVFVDDLTILANFGANPTPAGAVGALADGTSVVEVHGLRDATGNIVASRVELVQAPVAGNDELRGTVTALGTSSFTLQNGATSVTVNFSGTTTILGGVLANTQIVEVHGTFDANATTFTATLINIEDDGQFQHQPGEEFSIEGQVSGCNGASPCASFSVGTQAVQTNANTRFENGNAADVADGVRLEAEGHTFTGNTLVAEKVSFKRPRVILTGTAAVTGAIPGTGTLQVLGKSIQITTFTDIRAQDGVISNGERVEVRGFVDSTGAIVAQRIDDSPGGNASRSILQAQVTAESGKVLTMLGITADLNGTTQFENENGPISSDAFFATVTPATSTTTGTLVKVQGIFDSGTSTITVEEAEIEDD